MNHGTTYAHKKCEVCGKSWWTHTSDCNRHAFRPLGFAPGAYVLSYGIHAGATLDEVAANEDGILYLLELPVESELDSLEREVIQLYLKECPW